MYTFVQPEHGIKSIPAWDYFWQPSMGIHRSSDGDNPPPLPPYKSHPGLAIIVTVIVLYSMVSLLFLFVWNLHIPNIETPIIKITSWRQT